MRYSGIPSTTLFAEARLQQEAIGRADSELQPSGGNFVENLDYTRDLSGLRFGFNTSPWQAVMLSSHYRRYDDESDFLNREAPQPAGTYPGFIRARELNTDEVEAKLTLRPARWLKTTLSYQYLNTDSWTDTRPALNPGGTITYSPGGEILAGQFESHTYSVGATLTPWRRFYLDAAVSWQHSTTRTANNGATYIAPYRGELYSVFANGTYVLSAATDLFASYYFATAHYEQNNAANGLPLGIHYRQHGAEFGVRRRLGKHVSAQLQSGFYHYTEPTSGGANDYMACALFGAITLKLP